MKHVKRGLFVALIIFLAFPAFITQAEPPTQGGQDGKPVSGPRSGGLKHFEDGYVKTYNAAVKLRDFTVEATFVNPYSAFTGTFDFGFGFRNLDFNEQYRLVITSQGEWFLQWGLRDATQLGYLSVVTAANGKNKLRLQVRGRTGVFYLNERLIAPLDLSGNIVFGDIFVGTGFIEGNEITGSTTRYENFTVWDRSGEIPSVRYSLPVTINVAGTSGVAGPIRGDNVLYLVPLTSITRPVVPENVIWASGGTHFIVIDARGVFLYDVKDLKSQPKQLETFSGANNKNKPLSARSPKGDLAAVATRDASGRSVIKLWNVATGEAVRTLDAVTFVITGLQIIEEGGIQKLVVLGEAGKVLFLNLATGAVISEATAPIAAELAAYSTDGKIGVYATRDGNVAITKADEQAQGNTKSRPFKAERNLSALAMSPAGDVVATGGCVRESKGECTRGQITLFDANGRRKSTLVGHLGAVQSISFNADGSLLASAGGADNMVILWDVKTGKELARFEDHTSAVVLVTFSPDGRFILSSDSSGKSYMWGVGEASAGEGRTIPADRKTPPQNSEVLMDGIGLSNRGNQQDGEFQVEGYCPLIGYRGVRRSNTDWYCVSGTRGTRRLLASDFDKICQQTYSDDAAFAIQNGTSRTPAFNWRCYTFSR